MISHVQSSLASSIINDNYFRILNLVSNENKEIKIMDCSHVKELQRLWGKVE